MTQPRFWAAALALAVATPLSSQADLVWFGNRDLHRYEWRASTFEPSAQHDAVLDIGPDGQIVAVWASRRQQEGLSGIYAQRFDPSGVAIGTEFAVGQTRVHQIQPVVAMDCAGNTWIAWQAHNQDGQAGGIVARRFDAAFNGGPEFIVNQQRDGHQSQPVLAVSARGTAAIIWTSVASPKEPVRLHGRMFGPDGAPVGDEFRVSETATRTETIPSVVFGRDDTLAVVFSVFDEKMDPAGIRMQRLDAPGRRLGDEIVVSGPARSSQIEPVVAATPDGYLVAWLDAESDGDDYGVLARRFDREGRPRCDPFVVNTTRQGPQNAAAIAVARDGRFAIAWDSRDGDESGVFAQMFAADGARIGEEFRVNRYARGPQAMKIATGSQRLAFGPRDELVCVWDGDANLGDKSSVNVTMLSPAWIDPAGRTQGVTAAMPAATPANAAEPHRPPIFDPRTIIAAPREVRPGPEFGFTGVVDTGWTPPDPHMAIGPNHIAVMTNGAIAFYTKDGTQTFQDEIEDSFGFWGSVGATGFVFDPEVLYDELSGRFFAMAAEAYAPGNKSYVLVAVSDDSDPNGTWYKYRFNTTPQAGNLFDSPNIGVDKDVVYVTGDGFGFSANYPVYTFDKASLLAGKPPAVQKATLMPTSTQSAGIPPVSFDDPPALYMIEHKEASSNNKVRLIALRDPLGAMTFTSYELTVPTYGPPEDPPQKGTSSRPETFDARFWSVAYRNGSLWATQHINSSRVIARWYEIAMNGWPTSGKDPVLVQSGDIDPGATIRTFFSSISVNERGDAALTCARSSPTEYISMMTAYRLETDPLGAFGNMVIQKASDGPYAGYNRWGDYSAVNPDPMTSNVFWAHHEYHQSGSWRTWVAKIELPILLGDLNCDGKLDAFDIDPFVLAMTDPASYVAQYPDCDPLLADVNGDGAVDVFDVEPFVKLLTGG